MTSHTEPLTLPDSNVSRLRAPDNPPRRALAGLAAMSVMCFVLITAEFLPGGLLTPIARELGVTDGQAGQTVTVTAFAGLLVAPTIAAATARIDRRTVMVVLASLAALSNLAVAFAPNLPVLLVSRFFIGVAIGGFWSLSLAVVSRVTQGGDVAKGMMIVNVGNTLATVIGVPFGIALSTLASWRDVFVGVAVVTALVTIALRLLLPAIAPEGSTSLREFARVAMRPGITMALIGHVLIVLGHIAAYAYIRVALERIDGINDAGIPILLLVFGIGGFAGNLLIGLAASRHLSVLKWVAPLALGLCVLSLGLWPTLPVAATATALWGASFGGWLVVINTWTARAIPDRLEEGGGLAVVGFQLAIVIGGALGGAVTDAYGPAVLFVVAGIIALIGGFIFATAAPSGTSASSDVSQEDGARPV